MDAFNIMVGTIGLLAAGFAIFVYVDAKRKEAVETQKSGEYRQRLADLLSMANAIAQQGSMAAALADRDDVSKKEIKHLIVMQLTTISSIQASLERTRTVEQRWRFGVPDTYLSIQQAPVPPAQSTDNSKASHG